MRNLGKNEEKLLILLLTGLALPFTRSARAQYRLLKTASGEWRKVSRYGVPRTVRLLEEKKLVTLVRSKDGIYLVRPTKSGRERATLQSLIATKPVVRKKWDGQWRLVVFDIPEAERKMRNILRQCLRSWDFYKLQASVFITPYDCREAVELLIQACQGERYIRFIEAKHISRDQDVRKHFALL